MLTTVSTAARGWGVSLMLAVFFSASVSAQDESLSVLETGLNELVYRLSRSVVTVEASRATVREAQPTIVTRGAQSLISSGLIWDSSGHVLVSASMIDGFDRLRVFLESRVLDARLVGIDYFNEIALLAVDSLTGVPVTVSDAHTCAGHMVIGLGNTFGVRASPSIGFCAGARPDGTLQFTFPVTSGGLGGGVFDLSGKLIGLVSGAIGARNEVAIALPAYRLANVVAYLLEHGDRLAGYIGISASDVEVSADPTNDLTAMTTSTTGQVSSPSPHFAVMVTEVQPGSPAMAAGIQAGDILYDVDGNEVGSSVELATLVRLHYPGSRMNLGVVRRGRQLTIPVRVGAKKLSPAPVIGQDRAQAVSSADSLRRIVRQLREQVRRLEQRLDALH
ncbi:MAG: serine protease [Candidatus Zixiibacteriota bacterium]|nr:MAG: serine protease [candidate division Zixibacteria bacterium]